MKYTSQIQPSLIPKTQLFDALHRQKDEKIFLENGVIKFKNNFLVKFNLKLGDIATNEHDMYDHVYKL